MAAPDGILLMEFAEVLRHRKMVRNYQELPVARETLERVVAAARKAPSAGFSQGVSFVIVTDSEVRQKIADLADEGSYVAAGFDPWISLAPAHVVVAVSEQAYHDRYREPDKLDADEAEISWPIPFWWVDAGAAMMLLLLAAVDAGLAAGFLGVHSVPGLSQLLQIPAEVTPIGVVTMGYPRPDRRSGSLDRGWKPAGQVIHWESWQ